MQFNRLAPFFGPSFDIDGWRTWLSVWPVIDFTMNRAAGFYDFDAQVVAAELLPWSSPKPSDPRLKNAPGKLTTENHTPECGTSQPTTSGRSRG